MTRRWLFAAVLFTLLTSACNAEPLASKVDDLLRAGKTAEAAEEIRSGLPELIKAGNAGQVDDLSVVLARNQRAATSSSVEAAGDGALQQAFDRIESKLTCSNIVNGGAGASSVRLDGASATYDAWKKNSERRKALQNICKALNQI